MITPAFSPTATERVLPKLALDFTTASLDPRVTCSRTTSATNPATYYNSSGLVALATNNQPRFDYDPVTLVCKGLLIEESRANIALQSEDFGTTWTTVRASISTNAAVAPDGNMTADKIVEDTTASASHYAQQAGITVTAQSYAASVYVKSAGRTQCLVRMTNFWASGNDAYFDLTAGTVLSKGASALSATIQNVGNGWWRCTVVSGTAIAGSNGQLQVFPAVNGNNSYTGNGSDGIYVWGAQLEAGAFATSYIPTTTTSLTRNADNVGMTGTNFSDWYTPNSALFFTGALTGYNTSTHNCIGSISNTANNQYLDYRLFDRFTGATRINGNAGQLIALQAPALNTRYKVGTSNNNTVRLAGAMAGNAVVASAIAGTLAGAEKLNIGRRFDGASDYLNGWAVNVYSYPLTITDAELRAFSK